MFPKISNPLAKSIRTGEGIVIYATNVVLVLAAVLPHGLSWTHSGLYLAILNGVNAVSRSGIKIAAINKGVGIGAPIEVDPVAPSTIESVVGAAVSDTEKAVQAEVQVYDQAEDAQKKPESGVKADGPAVTTASPEAAAAPVAPAPAGATPVA